MLKEFKFKCTNLDNLYEYKTYEHTFEFHHKDGIMTVRPKRNHSGSNWFEDICFLVDSEEDLLEIQKDYAFHVNKELDGKLEIEVYHSCGFSKDCSYCQYRDDYYAELESIQKLEEFEEGDRFDDCDGCWNVKASCVCAYLP